jgi:hypothetical protein
MLLKEANMMSRESDGNARKTYLERFKKIT